MKASAPEDLRHYILATAGHVDHGKSSLVRALTGIDPDRLPEEKARGITIDLGFAHLMIPPYQIGIVDVPGHEDFVRNMVSGVGCIDAALLVVAADDGWMPQTEEHLQILDYLGVKSGVIALTKVDLIEDASVAIADVREKLAGTAFASAPIVASSCADRRGMSDLRQAIAAVLAHTPAQLDYGKPRLAIDRAFSLKGIGTVVTGTLIGGTIMRGQEVILLPQGALTRVRAVQSHGREVEIAKPGTRVALNLPDVRVGDGFGAVKRGDVVTTKESAAPSRQLLVRLIRTARQETAGLRNATRLWFHHLSSATAARVRLINQDSLRPGEECFAILALESPVLAFVGDRFVLRDWSGRTTLAGGVIIDPDARGKRGRCEDPWRRERWENLEHPDVLVKTQLELEGLARADLLLRKSPLTQERIAAAVNAHCQRGTLARCGDWIALADLMNQARQAMVCAIDAHHAAHPEQGGLPVPARRKPLQRVMRRVPREALLALEKTLLEALCRDGFLCTNGTIRRATHRPALPPRLALEGHKLRSALNQSPFDPPSRKQLCRSDLALQALKFLIANGEAIELSHDVVISSQSYHEAIQAIAHHLHECTRATVADLKKVVPASRRVMVPLLERLDREGLTRRQGDWRVLK